MCDTCAVQQFPFIYLYIAVEGSGLLGCYRMLMGKLLPALQRFVLHLQGQTAQEDWHCFKISVTVLQLI
jgi:hypothetical protein